MSRSIVFVAHGLLESSAGIYNLFSCNRCICPVDPEPAATSLTLVGGELWSYSVISMGIGSLLAANAPDDSPAKRAICVAAMFYHGSIVVSGIYRAVRGWTYLGGRSAKSHVLGVLLVHGVLALWFLAWYVRSRRTCVSQGE